MRKYAIILILPLLFLRAGYAAPKHAPSRWSHKMNELLKVLTELLPDVSSEARFDSPKNARRIEESAKKLASLAHSVGRDSQNAPDPGAKPSASAGPTGDSDLSVPLIANLFQVEARRAYRELERGHRSYARSVLKTIPSFCIGCHTRTNSGPDLSQRLSKAFPDLQKTFPNPIDRGEFLAATRQFDPALDDFEKVIGDQESARGRQLEWEHAVHDGLAIAVRVKRDPSRALAIVNRVIDSPSCPQFLRQDAVQWKRSIEEWKNEAGRIPKTEEGLFAESKRLIAQAREIRKYPADRSADVVFLRATAMLHDQLRIAPEGKHSGEALFLLGISYEALRDLDLWSLHELYYQACIHRVPHSETAQACYRRFEQDTYAGYSGSAGLSLPDDVRKQLADLRKLAAMPESPGGLQ